MTPLHHFIPHQSYHSKKLPLTEWAFLYPTHALSTAATKFWVLSEWSSEFRSKFPRKCRGNEICSERLNSGCIKIIIPNWIQSLGVIFLVTEHLLYIAGSTHLCHRNGYLSHLFPALKKSHIFYLAFFCMLLYESFMDDQNVLYTFPQESFHAFIFQRHASSFTPSLRS